MEVPRVRRRGRLRRQLSYSRHRARRRPVRRRRRRRRLCYSVDGVAAGRLAGPRVSGRRRREALRVVVLVVVRQHGDEVLEVLLRQRAVAAVLQELVEERVERGISRVGRVRGLRHRVPRGRGDGFEELLVGVEELVVVVVEGMLRDRHERVRRAFERGADVQRRVRAVDRARRRVVLRGVDRAAARDRGVVAALEERGGVDGSRHVVALASKAARGLEARRVPARLDRRLDGARLGLGYAEARPRLQRRVARPDAAARPDRHGLRERAEVPAF